MNVNTMQKTKKYTHQLASLMGGPLNSKKKIFCTKVGDKQLNDKYSDKIQWLF